MICGCIGNLDRPVGLFTNDVQLQSIELFLWVISWCAQNPTGRGQIELDIEILRHLWRQFQVQVQVCSAEADPARLNRHTVCKLSDVIFILTPPVYTPPLSKHTYSEASRA